MIEDYKLKCTRYYWWNTQDLSKVNFFSDEVALRAGEVDLVDYLMDVSDLSLIKESTKTKEGINKSFLETSDITLTLTGIKNERYLQSFFKIYENTDRWRWLLEVYNSRTQKIYKGIINPDNIEIPFKPSSDSEVIKVTALGFDKEFKKYYSQLQLKGTDNQFLWNDADITPLLTLRPGDSYPRKVSRIENFLSQTFDSPFFKFSVEDSIKNWGFIKNPFLGKSANLSTDYWIKSSYERIAVNGDNRYDVLRRACNAMGWIFYNDIDVFKIQNRSTGFGKIYLDANKIMDYTVMKEQEIVDYDHVIILDGHVEAGRHTDGGDAGGARFNILTYLDYVGKNPEAAQRYNGRWWSAISDTYRLNQRPSGWRLQWYYNEDTDNWRYSIRQYTASDYGWKQCSMRKKDILFIDIGDTGDHAWMFKIGTGRTGPHSPFNSGHSEDEIIFKGNYGNALVETNGHAIVNTYETYSATQLFYNNFIKFFRSLMQPKLKVSYKGVVRNIFSNAEFANITDQQGLTGEYHISNIKLNIKNDTTQMELIQVG